MELDDELRRRARIRASADEKMAAYRLNEAIRNAILRKSRPIRELYHPGEHVAFWRDAKYKQGKKGQRGRRIPAAWYRGVVIGPHKGDGDPKQNNYWISSGGKCILAAREQMRPAFGTELWPVHEREMQQVMESPPDSFYDIRTEEIPGDDEADDVPDPVPLFEAHPEPEPDMEDVGPSGRADSALGSDRTQPPTRAPGTPVGSLVQPSAKRARLGESSAAPSAATPGGSISAENRVVILEEQEMAVPGQMYMTPCSYGQGHGGTTGTIRLDKAM